MKLKDEDRRKMLEEIILENVSTAKAAAKYGICRGTVYQLVRRARTNGIDAVLHGTKHPGFTREFKLEVLDYLGRNYSIADTCVHYNLNETVVRQWRKKYSEGGPEALSGPAERKTVEPKNEEELDKLPESEQIAFLKKKVKDLNEELSLEKMENAVLKKLKALAQQRVEREGRK